MRWIWDEDKNRANLRKHRLSFETAALIFADPLQASQPDPHPDGDRWQTIGQVGNVFLFVVHALPGPDSTGEEIGRIISARRATARERRVYEEGEF